MDEVTKKVVDGTAWREFCDMLADAGNAILEAGNPDDPLDRAEGFRMLTRLLRCAFETKLEYGRSEDPQLICTCHETMKIVGENPDNHYLGASLDGKYDYRDRARGARQNGSASTSSRGADSAAADLGLAPPCTRSRCTSSRTAASRS